MKARLLPLALILAVASITVAQTNSSHWIDATAPLDPKTTPVFPGDAPIKLDFLQSFDTGGKLTLSSFSMGAHSGTHIDAPMHFIKNGASLDQLSLENFLGPVRIIDCSPEATEIDAAELNKHKWQGAKRVFFRTRNSRNNWMTDPNFHKDFTYIG